MFNTVRDIEGDVNEIWKPDSFLLAEISGPRSVPGYIYKGLGLHQVFKASPKGRRPPTWGLTHLGTGLNVCFIQGTVATAFPVATQIAECGDWDFDGPDGWRNHDPDLPAKAMEIINAHGMCKRGGNDSPVTREVARQVAMARAG